MTGGAGDHCRVLHDHPFVPLSHDDVLVSRRGGTTTHPAATQHWLIRKLFTHHWPHWLTPCSFHFERSDFQINFSSVTCPFYQYLEIDFGEGAPEGNEHKKAVGSSERSADASEGHSEPAAKDEVNPMSLCVPVPG